MIDDLHKLPIIAFGRKSTIYALNNTNVIKVYDPSISRVDVEREYKHTCLVAQSTSIPVPRPYRFYLINNSPAIEFERVEGRSYMQEMMAKPWNVFRYFSSLATLHNEVHSYSLPLITQKEKYEQLVNRTPRITSNEKDTVNECFKLLEHGTFCVCHGDFHQGNVLLSKNNTYIIDWFDSFYGHPFLDIALTAVNGVISTAPPHIPKVYRLIFDYIAPRIRLDIDYFKRSGLYETWKRKDKTLLSACVLASAIHLARSPEESRPLATRYFKRILRRFDT